jgi:triphosphatase
MTPPRTWSRPDITARASAGEAFVANVRAALEQIDVNVAGAAAGRDPEYLHQLRVGLRRMRSTLRAFRPLLRRRKAAEFDDLLREILRALGAARDWDVFLRLHRDPGLVRAARGRGAAARRQARGLLRSTVFLTTPRSVLAWAKRAPWRSDADPREPVARFARRALQRLRERVCADADAVDWHDAAQRHKVRVKIKRLRYGCECFAAAYPKRKVRPYLKRLRSLQQILGEMNDITVQRTLLRQLAGDARLRKAAAALRADLALRERGLSAEAARAWGELEARKPFWRRAAAARARG